MPRTKGAKDNIPRKQGGGRRPSVDYAARAIEDPSGTTDLLIRDWANSDLALIYSLATQEHISVQEWIRHAAMSKIADRLVV